MKVTSQPVRPRSVTARIPSPAPARAETGVVDTVKRHLAHGVKNAALNSSLVLSSNLAAIGATTALSAAFPHWVPYGGFLGNILVGAVVGGVAGRVCGGRMVKLNGVTGWQVAETPGLAAVTGAVIGAVAGLATPRPGSGPGRRQPTGGPQRPGKGRPLVARRRLLPAAGATLRRARHA